MTNTELPLEFSNVEPIEIQEEMERSFLDYAMSVIVARALPDVRDGLKPVHRRILWAMFDQGYTPNRALVKCAKVPPVSVGRSAIGWLGRHHVGARAGLKFPRSIRVASY